MYNGKVIRTMLAERSIQHKELLTYLGSDSNSSLLQIIDGNPTVKRLERVADFFGCSMDVFFNREAFQVSGNKNEQQHLLEKIQLLEALVLEKERFIQEILNRK